MADTADVERQADILLLMKDMWKDKIQRFLPVQPQYKCLP